MIRARHPKRIVLAVLAGALVAFSAWRISGTGTTGGAAPSGSPLAVKVSGNRLVDHSGRPLRLLGVNRSGTEYACVQGWGIFEGPTDDASVAAIAAWHVNVVRLPLNEDCWLGLGPLDPSLSGAAYQDAIANYVDRLHKAGMYVILDLHWNEAGRGQATDQQAMADALHAPAFWASVASHFRNDPAVLFDLYNEPNSISWTCWRDGCTVPGGWAAAGMQSLVDAVRATGARQPLILSGLAWANDLSGWAAAMPHDPDGQLVAGFHVYNGNRCNTASCWDTQVAPVAARVPVVTTEFGEDDCATSFVAPFMDWSDAHGVSYVAWTWNQWSCQSHGLITGEGGTPSPYGTGLRDHLAAVAAPGVPIP